MSDINMDVLTSHIKDGRNFIVGGFGGQVYTNSASVSAGKNYSSPIYADRIDPDQVNREIFSKDESEIIVIVGFGDACPATQEMIVELVKDRTIHGEKVPNTNSIVIISKNDDVNWVDSRLLNLIPVREGFDD